MIRHWHKPGAFALVLTCAGIALFVSLGRWQLRRAHDKIELFAAFAGAAQQAPISLTQARSSPAPAHYPLVRVLGRYDARHAYVLDNQTRNGRAGVMLFDVFQPADGSLPLLVNRGFLARDARGARPPPPAPPSGNETVLALYAPPPGSGLRLGGNPLPAQQTWPKTTIYIDLDEISADLGHPLDRRVLLLTSANQAAASDRAFVRQWTPDVFPPERHFAYAFTWFLFAGVCVVAFVIVHWRRESTQ